MNKYVYKTISIRANEASRNDVDIEDLAKRIMNACNHLYNEGYDVIHISDVIRGKYLTEKWEGSNKHGFLGSDGETWGAGWGYGYGFSMTDGAVITAKLREP